jgi:hypothetical protein
MTSKHNTELFFFKVIVPQNPLLPLSCLALDLHKSGFQQLEVRVWN